MHVVQLFSDGWFGYRTGKSPAFRFHDALNREHPASGYTTASSSISSSNWGGCFLGASFEAAFALKLRLGRRAGRNGDGGIAAENLAGAGLK